MLENLLCADDLSAILQEVTAEWVESEQKTSRINWKKPAKGECNMAQAAFT